MRSGPLAPALALALAFGLMSARSSADPVPVHVATVRGGRGVAAANAERLQVADAIAAVLAERVPEVLSGTETRTRIEALNPSAAQCDGLDCITAITLPLHARALVLVRVSRLRDGAARIETRLVNLRGEVLAERTEQELAPTSAELVALARLGAASIAEAMRAQEPVAPPPPPVVAAPAPAPAPVIAEPARPPPAPTPQRQRRMPLVFAGAGALALGVAGVTVGIAGLTSGERVTQSLPDDRVLVERGSPLNWVWLGGGIAALGVGAWLVIDGLRPRPVGLQSASLIPLPGGAAVSAAGAF